MQTNTQCACRGQAAALHFKLTSVRRVLAASLERQSNYLDEAATYRALAAEAGTARIREDYFGTELLRRTQAHGCQPEIDQLRKRVADIERELKDLAATEAAIGEVMA